eukprot:6184265-Pleurochrysis_carterae.AAC.2
MRGRGDASSSLQTIAARIAADYILGQEPTLMSNSNSYFSSRVRARGNRALVSAASPSPSVEGWAGRRPRVRQCTRCAGTQHCTRHARLVTHAHRTCPVVSAYRACSLRAHCAARGEYLSCPRQCALTTATSFHSRQVAWCFWGRLRTARSAESTRCCSHRLILALLLLLPNPHIGPGPMAPLTPLCMCTPAKVELPVWYHDVPVPTAEELGRCVRGTRYWERNRGAFDATAFVDMCMRFACLAYRCRCFPLRESANGSLYRATTSHDLLARRSLFSRLKSSTRPC